MNIGIIFAGGAGIRMNIKDKPKQFLLVHGKPIIVHTIEVFNYHKEIDGIVVVCLADWIDYMEELKYRYRLDKISRIIPGGNTGQLSIYNGLIAAKEVYGEDNIVLIHDGVRPIISEELVTANIAAVKKYGSSITCSKANETFVVLDSSDEVNTILERKMSWCAKAPQAFYLRDILQKHEQASSATSAGVRKVP